MRVEPRGLCVATMSASKVLLFVVGGFVALLLVLGLWGIATFNRLVRLEQSADAQWAQVQNVYQRRADLVPNLVSTVAGAANFEKSTIVEVTEARASVGQVKLPSGGAPADPAQLVEFEQAQSRLGGALSRLLVVAERYPDLKATANFRDLQAQLEGTENRIAVERGRFNEAVRDYNTGAKRFPGVLFGRPAKPYFAAAAGVETPPKVQFDFGTNPAGPRP